LTLSIMLKVKSKEIKKRKKHEHLFNKKIIYFFLIFLLIHKTGNLSRGILDTVFPFYLTDTFNKSKTEVGFFFSFGFGLATLISQIPSGLLADRLGRRKTIIYSISLTTLASLSFLFLVGYYQNLISFMLISAFWSSTWPASAAYLMEVSLKENRGVIMSLRLMAKRLGLTVGQLVGGFLLDSQGIISSLYAVIFFFILSFIFAVNLKNK